MLRREAASRYARFAGMTHFLAVALSFPSVVFTVLLGVALVYWLFVIVGAAHVNLLGEGAADGALDGAGHLEAGHADLGDAGGGADVDAGGGADGADVDVDVDGHAGHGLAGAMAALKLRSAPATVVLSAIILFSWLFSVLGMQAAIAFLPEVGVSVARFVRSEDRSTSSSSVSATQKTGAPWRERWCTLR